MCHISKGKWKLTSCIHYFSVVFETTTRTLSRTCYLTTYLALYVLSEISSLFSESINNPFFTDIVLPMES